MMPTVFFCLPDSTSIIVVNLCIQSRFSLLFFLPSQKNHTINIGSISSQLIASAKKLRQITPEQHECLRAFTDCPKFIAWVRTDVKSKYA